MKQSRVVINAYGREALILAVVWLVGMALADILISSSTVVLVVLFAVAPLIAAAAAGKRETAAVAVAAVGLTVVSPLWDGSGGAAKYTVRIIDIVLISGSAIGISAVRQWRERQLQQVTAIAESAQAAVLPTLPQTLGALSLRVLYRSASRAALVGGDLFDALETDGRVRLLVGDVKGKGLDAVGHAARTIRAFRQYGGTDLDLVGVAGRMSLYMSRFLGEEDFVTAVLAEVSSTGELTVVACGHPPPAVRLNGEVTILADGDSSPLGLAEPLGLTPVYSAYRVRCCPGDRILLYTDGLTEARDPQGQFLPTSLLTGPLDAATIGESLTQLLMNLDGHTLNQGVRDDLALVVAEVGPGSAGQDQLESASPTRASSSAKSNCGEPPNCPAV